MVWDCMTVGGVDHLVHIEGTMYKEQDEKILMENARILAKKLKMKSFIFQQDNEPKHKAGKISQWFINNHTDTLE